jgi:thiol-disulfide isomerase/thioredoxin
VAAALGLWWRSRNGRYTAVDPALLGSGPADGADDSRLTARELGAPLGATATFVQFSSEVCAPCRRTHAVLAQLVSERVGLSHVEMDVVEHLDLVRRFDIMRTPTTLLLDADGVVVGRMSGATDRRHALAALEASCPGGISAV